ncbi:MAG: M23 family metallopeptidase [Planctomycetota bacterium]
MHRSLRLLTSLVLILSAACSDSSRSGGGSSSPTPAPPVGTAAPTGEPPEPAPGEHPTVSAALWAYTTAQQVHELPQIARRGSVGRERWDAFTVHWFWGWAGRPYTVTAVPLAAESQPDLWLFEDSTRRYLLGSTRTGTSAERVSVVPGRSGWYAAVIWGRATTNETYLEVSEERAGAREFDVPVANLRDYTGDGAEDYPPGALVHHTHSGPHYTTLYTDGYTGYDPTVNGEGTGGHPGVDIGVDRVDVLAAASGWVVYVGTFGGGWGQTIVVLHANARAADGDPVYGIYTHLSRRDVQVNAFVARGSVLGVSGDGDGAWAPHLHFQLDKHSFHAGQAFTWVPYFPSRTLAARDTLLPVGGATNLQRLLDDVTGSTENPMTFVQAR